MDAITIILFTIAGVFLIIYLFKIGKAKKLITQADRASSSGNDREALKLYKSALIYANEKPTIEQSIISKIDTIYQRHNIKHNFDDYQTLISNSKKLLKRSSSKASNELAKINQLKEELRDKMPSML